MTGDPFEMSLPTAIILDEMDVDRLLRFLYNGRRPQDLHIMACSCGALADLEESPGAWNGWQILPYALCPDCLAAGRFRKMKEIADLYPSQAYERFVKQLEQVLLEKARGGNHVENGDQAHPDDRRRDSDRDHRGDPRVRRLK